MSLCYLTPTAKQHSNNLLPSAHNSTSSALLLQPPCRSTSLRPFARGLASPKMFFSSVHPPIAQCLAITSSPSSLYLLQSDSSPRVRSTNLFTHLPSSTRNTWDHNQIHDSVLLCGTSSWPSIRHAMSALMSYSDSYSQVLCIYKAVLGSL